jgi:predicted glycoside hydrolase/deacetylase ChbG (UPF0249 family)
MAARLILNADDFGLTRGINRAIGELAAAGAITSATLMAAGPAFDDAVETAHAHPQLGVGCHVTLVDGMPLLPAAEIPSLVVKGCGRFRSSLRAFQLALLRGAVREEEMAREAEAQIRKLQAAGLCVTHVDTHKHTHMLPAVARALLLAAERTGVQAVRNPFEPAWSAGGGLARRALVAATNLLRPRFESLLAEHPAIKTTGGTLGIAATGSLDAKELQTLLRAIPAAGDFELVLHPGYNDADLDCVHTRLSASREIEREVLLQVFSGGMHPSQTHLIHYGELQNTQPSAQKASKA